LAVPQNETKGLFMSRTKIGLLVVSMMLVLGLAACATGPQVNGNVTGISLANRTLTVDGQLIHVPKNIRMIKSGNPIPMQSIAIGDRVVVRYQQSSDGGREAANILLLPSNSGKEGRK